MWRRLLFGGAFAVLLALVVGVSVAFPAVAATTCPGCYGLAWFDEGLAVLVSDDPRYLRPDGDRCLVEPVGPLPETLDGWLRAASADAQVYAQAACAVSRWTATGDVHALVADLAAGGAFPR